MKLPSIKNKKLITAVIIVLILILAAIFKFFPVFQQSAANPQETAENAVAGLTQTPALSFSTISQLNINEKNREYGNITGEFLQNGDFHICGDILGSKLDLYQLDDTTYRLDNVTGSWQKTSENPEIYDTALFNETNPLAQFDFADFGTVEEINTQEKNLYCFRFVPKLKSDSISKYFTDITYTIYCNREGKLTKSVVNGKLTNNSVSGQLTITTEFTPLPDDYQLEAPITD